ncbi:hypothetical protein [Stenotrophomonas sp. RAC2]|uniref:hypothetical protein n=1 Tax=Stenotrophomonas sp. RAC2 TaxID=3064902 RepID=UPI002721AEA6|nr:hypothetical protein [Stenotrophomonas sp. RAC2]MDV9040994.1 hypothetical protein [Stenotrophomonas sp. RAC2]
MDWKTSIAVVGAAAAIAAVGYWSLGQRNARAEFEASVPVCVTAEECEAARNAARHWVTSNTVLPIQTDLPVLLRTQRPNPELHGASAPAMTVTYATDAAGKTRIEFAAECGSPTGCSTWELGSVFNGAVSQAIRSAQ